MRHAGVVPVRGETQRLSVGERYPVCEGMIMTSYAAWGALVVVLVAAVMASGCTTSLPFASAPSSKSRDLSGSYDAAFVKNNWKALTPFVQTKANVYSGEYVDARGQTWNFSIELSSSENESFGRYFEVMKEFSDNGFVKANSSKVNVGTGSTVFGTVDEVWYGYKTTGTINTQLCVLFFSYDESNDAWVFVTAQSEELGT
ncbi:MAG: hypothetical protein ACXV6K_08685, partial [Halobacteriota archaeon]